MPSQPTIECVRFEVEPDPDYDTSHLGEFSPSTGESYHINRELGILFDNHGNVLAENIATAWFPGNYYLFIIPSFNHLPYDPRNWEHVDEAKLETLLEHNADAFKEHRIATANVDPRFALDVLSAIRDAERLEKWGRGDWEYLYITAIAVVRVSTDDGNTRFEDFTSFGCNVESDADGEYLDGLKREQLADLTEYLTAFGITTTTEELEELATRNCHTQLVTTPTPRRTI